MTSADHAECVSKEGYIPQGFLKVRISRATATASGLCESNFNSSTYGEEKESVGWCSGLTIWAQEHITRINLIAYQPPEGYPEISAREVTTKRQNDMIASFSTRMAQYSSTFLGEDGFSVQDTRARIAVQTGMIGCNGRQREKAHRTVATSRIHVESVLPGRLMTH